MKVVAAHTRWSGIAAILRREITELAIISAYLYVCFGALLLFKTAVLRAQGIGYAPYGIAAVKAVVLGKFMLIGNHLHLGERFTTKPLIYPLVHKVIVFLMFLFVLSLVEEVVLAGLHGQSMRAAFSEFDGGTWLQITSSSILICLILFPYFGLQAIGGALGVGKLGRMFFSN